MGCRQQQKQQQSFSVSWFARSAKEFPGNDINKTYIGLSTQTKDTSLYFLVLSNFIAVDSLLWIFQYVQHVEVHTCTYIQHTQLGPPTTKHSNPMWLRRVRIVG